ncbi:MAG: hypothetical protein R3C05_07760 [Pirellulaceae bacterium]
MPHDPYDDAPREPDDITNASNTDDRKVELKLTAPAGSLYPNQTFQVDISALEIDPRLNGIGGLSIDVDWNPNDFRLVLDPGKAIGDLVTENLPAFRGGTLDVGAGLIDELSGAAFEATGLGRAIGDGTPETFATLTFEALKATDASSIRVSLGDGGVGLVGDTSGEQVDVADAVTTVEIATAALPPLIEVTTSSGGDTLQFGGARANGTRGAFIRPGSAGSLEYIEIANVGESVLEVYEIQFGTTAVTIAAGDADARGGFSVGPGQSRRIALELSSGVAMDLNTSEGITIVSNAGNRGRYAVSAAAHTTFAADLNLDGRVNVSDVVLLDTVFGRAAGDGLYSRDHDINGDGSIDLGDFGLLNAQFGMQRTARSDSTFQADEDEDLESILDLLAVDVSEDRL